MPVDEGLDQAEGGDGTRRCSRGQSEINRRINASRKLKGKAMAKEFGKATNGPTHEEIAERAYEIFEKSGRKPGHDLENWLAAESQLATNRRQDTTARTDTRPTASGR